MTTKSHVESTNDINLNKNYSYEKLDNCGQRSGFIAKYSKNTQSNLPKYA